MNEETTLLIPLTKIDAARREVWGTAAVEAVDHAKELMDFATSKPNFEKWSQNVFKATGGKSYGNVREMHSKIAAGKLIKMELDPATKTVRVGVKVVDDLAWRKCQEGVYAGFSVGGSYGKRWPDPMRPGVTRYEAKPSEISLVDYPCMPEAVFELVKADGATELRKGLGLSGGHMSKAAKLNVRTSEDPEISNTSKQSDNIEEQDETNDGPKEEGEEGDIGALKTSAAPTPTKEKVGSVPKQPEQNDEGEAAPLTDDLSKAVGLIADRVDAGLKKAFPPPQGQQPQQQQQPPPAPGGGGAPDANRVQGAHDMAVELGAKCANCPTCQQGQQQQQPQGGGGGAPFQKVEDTMDLKKALIEDAGAREALGDVIDACLQKALKPLHERLGALETENTELKKSLPEPARGTLRSVPKEGDATPTGDGGDLTKGLDLNTPGGLIKAAHRGGGFRVGVGE